MNGLGYAQDILPLSPMQDNVRIIHNRSLLGTHNHQTSVKNVVAKRGFLFGGSFTPSCTIPYGKDKFKTSDLTKSKSDNRLKQEGVDIEEDDGTNFSINWARLMTQNTQTKPVTPQNFDQIMR